MPAMNDRDLVEMRITKVAGFGPGEVAGPLGMQEVDARASDALNLAARTGAAVFVSPAVLDDFRERRDGEAADASLLRLAPTVPPMTIGRPHP